MQKNKDEVKSGLKSAIANSKNEKQRLEIEKKAKHENNLEIEKHRHNIEVNKLKIQTFVFSWKGIVSLFLFLVAVWLCGFYYFALSYKETMDFFVKWIGFPSVSSIITYFIQELRYKNKNK